jgi:hypothetical protein
MFAPLCRMLSAADFCGYFEVFPESHKLVGTGYYHSFIPRRFEQWSTEATLTNVWQMSLPYITPGWRLAYRRYWELFDTRASISTMRQPMDRLRMSSRPSWLE